MQNRLVLTGIPSAVPRLPKASDSLKNWVEDRACWIDRFAFLSARSANSAADDNDNDGGRHARAAAVELHIENVRDKAVKSLDGTVISMDREGRILDDESAVADDGERDGKERVSFRIRARPANEGQSAELIRKCPLRSDDAAGEKRMEKQTLRLPLDDEEIELSVRRSEVHGGTGTFPWRGGLVLSRQICEWATDRARPPSVVRDDGATTGPGVRFESLFVGRRVLELGAGAAGLPSMTLGRICDSRGLEADLVCTDGVDEIVCALRANARENGLDGRVRVRRVDWNDCARVDGRGSVAEGVAGADTIIFADCVYNDECAASLSRTIARLLKPGGNVVGVLPDFRVGLDTFERRMKEEGFVATDIPIVAAEGLGDFACSGGGGKDYRLVLWRDSTD
mmetsp:Transcript_53854/g.114404  ORF Transcript_53854/g.114404 Transcript_53854/m.114404 type:complete len:397 (-) Transcript_53854:125-1315(-)